MDREGGGAERFQGSFCSLFCCHHLMAVFIADPIYTFSPIFLVSQLASLLTFPTLHRITGMEPTPSSPSPLTPSLQNVHHKLSSSAKGGYQHLLKEKNLFERRAEMIPWTADFATSVAWRGGILKIMLPGRRWFNAVALSAYKECPAQDEEDRRRYRRQRRQRRRRRHFQFYLCISTCPPSTQSLQP